MWPDTVLHPVKLTTKLGSVPSLKELRFIIVLFSRKKRRRHHQAPRSSKFGRKPAFPVAARDQTTVFKRGSYLIIHPSVVLARAVLASTKLAVPATVIQSPGRGFLLARMIRAVDKESVEGQDSREPNAHRSISLPRTPTMS